MFKTNIKPVTGLSRTFQRNASIQGEVHLSSRRVMRKIRLGKARPAIFHQFETLVELSDGSVIKRRSQAPKDEIRMIGDQRNNPLWNPNRSDIVASDPNATGKVNKFKQRFGNFEEESKEDFLKMMGLNAQKVRGGTVYDKKAAKGKK